MKAVLFDLDGTLLFKRPAVAEKWYELLTENGYAVSMDDADRAFAECEMWVGRQIQLENETGVRISDEDFKKGVIGCALTALGVSEAASELLADVWAGKYEKSYAAAEGISVVLDSLKAQGLSLGVVSNNYSSVRAVLDELGLTGYFNEIVISEEVGLYKPDPRILLHACALMGVEPGDTIYVGDHPFDVVCAADAGVHSAWVPVSRYMRLPECAAEPDLRPGSLMELCGMIEKHDGSVIV